jgi:hypothetical protein
VNDIRFAGDVKARDVRKICVLDLDVCKYPDELRARWWKVDLSLSLILYRGTRGGHEPDEWVYIERHTAWSIFGQRGWPKIKELMIACRLIECDGISIPGVKSLGYRPAKEHRGKQVHVRIITDLIQITQVDISRGYLRDGGREILSPLEEKLNGDLHHLRINPGVAAASIAEGDTEESRVHRLNRYTMWAEGDPEDREGRRDTIGRFHHGATNITSEMRHGLETEDGHRLVETDIKSSHPTIQAQAAEQWWRSGGTWTVFEEFRQEPKVWTTKVGKKVIKHVQHRYRIDPPIDPTAPASVSSLYASTRDRRSPMGSCPSDIVDLRSVCAQGIFYPEFAETIGIPYDTPEQKSATKVAFMSMAYGDARWWKPERVEQWNCLQRRWPTWAKFTMWSKTFVHPKGPGRLACDCQAFEAYIVLDRSGGRMMREIPGAPVVFAHDSGATTEEHVPAVRRIVTEEFGRFGIEPVLVTG